MALMRIDGGLLGITVGNQSAYADLIAAVEVHDLLPIIDRTFDLQELTEAFRYQEFQNHFGKICVRL